MVPAREVEEAAAVVDAVVGDGNVAALAGPVEVVVVASVPSNIPDLRNTERTRLYNHTLGAGTLFPTLG